MKQHGEDAPIEAAMRADAMLEKGDAACALIGSWAAALRTSSANAVRQTIYAGEGHEQQ